MFILHPSINLLRQGHRILKLLSKVIIFPTPNLHLIKQDVTWHPLDEHKEVRLLPRSAQDTHNVRVTQPPHHLDLLLHALAHLLLLVQRVAAERDLNGMESRWGFERQIKLIECAS